MRTSSKISFLNDRQTEILRALIKYPEGIITNDLFADVKMAMAKSTFTKELDELDEMKIIRREKTNGRTRMIWYSSFHEDREKMRNMRKRVFGKRLKVILKVAKNKEELFSQLDDLELEVERDTAISMFANAVYFKGRPKAMAWANFLEFEVLNNIHKSIQKTIRRKYGKAGSKEFYDYQNKKSEDYWFDDKFDISSLNKTRNRKVNK